MTEKILKDATQLGSSLTKFASEQLSSVLTELRGPVGSTHEPGDGDPASLGGLAANAMQIVNSVGSLIVHLSQYDLVRNDGKVLHLTAANPISSVTTHAGEKNPYPLLIENSGREALKVDVRADLQPEKGGEKTLSLAPQHADVKAGERKLITLDLPDLTEGKWALIISAVKDKNTIARKTVAVNVLAPLSGSAAKKGAAKKSAGKKRVSKKRARK